VFATQKNAQAESTSRIRPGLRWPILLVWFLVAAGYFALFVSSLPVLYERVSALASPPVPEVILAEAFALALAQVGLTPETLAIYVVIADIVGFLFFAVIGLLILVRKSDEWIGIASSLMLIAFGAVATSGVDLLVNNPDSPGIGFGFATGLAWIGFFMFMTIFPDGRFVPRWAAVFLGLFGLGFLALELFFLIPPRLEQPATVILLALFAFAPYSAIYRYRRVSNPIERQQTKWVVASFGAAFIYSFISFGLVPALFSSLYQANVFFVIFLLVDIALFTLMFAIIPVAIGVAIFRYRLWDIDVLVNRGLVYTLLTGSLIAIYFLIVAAIQFVLRAITGQESPLAVVISTLAIAALFNPLRQRIQSVIDRRLYRRKYDAERTLEAFGVTVRDEVDLSKLSDSLLEIVDRSLQPSGAELWLKETEGSQIE